MAVPPASVSQLTSDMKGKTDLASSSGYQFTFGNSGPCSAVLKLVDRVSLSGRRWSSFHLARGMRTPCLTGDTTWNT